jgi:hypothetical protein
MRATGGEKIMKFRVVDDVGRPIIFGNPLDQTSAMNRR